MSSGLLARGTFKGSLFYEKYWCGCGYGAAVLSVCVDVAEGGGWGEWLKCFSRLWLWRGRHELISSDIVRSSFAKSGAQEVSCLRGGGLLKCEYCGMVRMLRRYFQLLWLFVFV